MNPARLVVLLALLVVTSSFAEAPKPAESKYLKSLMGMLLAGGGDVRYAMTYEIKDTMPDQFVIRVSFQNPKIGEAPLTEPGLLRIDGSHLLVQSQVLECIRNNDLYEVVVELFEDQEQEHLLDTHRQKIEFSVLPDQLEQLDLETC